MDTSLPLAALAAWPDPVTTHSPSIASRSQTSRTALPLRHSCATHKLTLSEISQRQVMNNLRSITRLVSLLAIIATTNARAATPLDVHIKDAATGKAIPDATVTITGKVL